MKKIPLTQGLYALVDDEDFEMLNQHNWSATRNKKVWYAMRKQGTPTGRRSIKMHQMLFPGAVEIDHKNRDGLDNRRCNLRPATGSQNMANRGMMKNNTSGYVGVSPHRQSGKWRAVIRCLGRYESLGLFYDPKEAAKVYNERAKKLFGTFAHLNSI